METCEKFRTSIRSSDLITCQVFKVISFLIFWSHIPFYWSKWLINQFSHGCPYGWISHSKSADWMCSSVCLLGKLTVLVGRFVSVCSWKVHHITLVGLSVGLSAWQVCCISRWIWLSFCLLGRSITLALVALAVRVNWHIACNFVFSVCFVGDDSLACSQGICLLCMCVWVLLCAWQDTKCSGNMLIDISELYKLILEPSAGWSVSSYYKERVLEESSRLTSSPFP